MPTTNRAWGRHLLDESATVFDSPVRHPGSIVAVGKRHPVRRVVWVNWSRARWHEPEFRWQVSARILFPNTIPLLRLPDSGRASEPNRKRRGILQSNKRRRLTAAGPSPEAVANEPTACRCTPRILRWRTTVGLRSPAFW